MTFNFNKGQNNSSNKKNSNNGQRPINEDIEKRYDPNSDYKNYRNGSHERKPPTAQEESYYFNED
ncbi:hypothetical protein ACFPVV_03000 [Macrococcoides bohemicum]|uniref:Uncharacterized protein n=1 Tax=Macrococcoides bohemicum TaxID=1903056 RepID=A0A328A7C2_9STAP|nr:hypothetical protein [Macrococcus bohemicus]RAK50443.1 hypothetical protein BHX94_02965 [Macrococcus bohemicus]